MIKIKKMKKIKRELNKNKINKIKFKILKF